MNPEDRENALSELGRFDFKYDEEEIEMDTDEGQHRRRPRSPTPPPSPLRPPPYHPQNRPDWEQEAEDEYEAVELNVARPQFSDKQELLEEQLGKWARPRRGPATIEDNDPSDDEYVEDDPELTMKRRIAMQTYRDQTHHPRPNALIDQMLASPDVVLQPRFADLPLELDEEMRALSVSEAPTRRHDPEHVWNTFWRYCDRNWCFFCQYRRTTMTNEYSDIYRLMMEKMTRPMDDHDEEVIVNEVQNMFFCAVQPHLPKRTPCRRTGRERPPRYLWKSMIRRHMHHHMLRPVHDNINHRKILIRLTSVLASSIVKKHKKNPTDVKVDLQKARFMRDTMEVIAKFGKDIQKDIREYR